MGQAEQFLITLLGMASVPPKPPGQEGGGSVLPPGVPGEGCDLG